MKNMTYNPFIKFFLFIFCISLTFATTKGSNNANIYINSLLSKRMLVGFLNIEDFFSTLKINIQKVKDDGYNTIVISDAYVSESKISFYQNNDTREYHILDKIHQAKKLGMKVLLSFGGSKNTFHPNINKDGQDPEILGKDMSNAQINNLAKNIIFF
ncbi:hypothetical protein IB692_08190 [Francisella noatunensis]|uniref:Uncharacterized protein n=2 Tax=Francisella noatunensis TaxID=657445 RepID=A0A9Q2KY17_9GAMM|nr:hypothetical protein [Francisella noatunensis]NBH64729.1 hypothetical protein [Francisella noatunensis subsp. noatunensis]MBK2034810.1 hypothetical protein [Francisella noatunensis]MBK2049296.1 hypothetical protein [Francisella noatunensis]MBK2050671.1 hypothetical protein [Francisella noatunensis]MBK2055627.1 hypothetical protein [Francisella noatunensis]